VTIKVIIEARIINGKKKKPAINAKTTGQKVGGEWNLQYHPTDY